jgi:hypothetical protein
MKFKSKEKSKKDPFLSRIMDAKQEKIKPIHVLAVILVLVVAGHVASGAYNDYLIRNRIANMLPVANDAKAGVEWYLKHMGPLPICNTRPEVNATTTGFTEIIPGAMKFIDKMWLNYNCVIEVRGSTKDIAPNIPGTISLVLCPKIQPSSGEIEWDCMYYDSNAEKGPWMQYVPKQCLKPFFWNGSGMNTCGH